MSSEQREHREPRPSPAAARRLRYLEAALASTGDGVIIVDAEGRLVYMNEAARRIARQEPAAGVPLPLQVEALGLHDLNGQPMPPGEDPLARSLRGYEAAGLQLGITTPDGREVTVSFTATPVRDEQGAIIGAISIFRDITEQKQAEEELQESEARFRTVFEEGPLGMALVNTDYRLTTVNARMAGMLGYTEQELVGRELAYILHPDDVAWGTELAGQLLRGEIPYYATEKRYIRKDGGIVWGRLTSSLIRGPGGEPRYFLGMLEDITQRKEAEAERQRLLESERRAREEAEAALHLRDQFLSVAAHELKTPLTSLRGQAELTMRRIEQGRLQDPGQVHHALHVIDRQVDRLSNLVAQLLDISRIETGELKLERRATDLVPLARGLIETMQAGTDRHTLSLHAPPSLEATVDPLRLEEVLYNLVDNGIRYSPRGGPVEVELSTPDPATVRIAVRDYGIGVPPEQRERLFTRFFQASRRPAGGLGLGLYISRRIVELHGGRIWAEFPEDGGSRFVVLLPRRGAGPAG